MQIKQTQNLHTHSTFSDGRNTPEEIIRRAIRCGFDAIGFSDHTEMPFDNEYHMAREKIALYKNAISELKEKYKGQIDVYCGLEVDLQTGERYEGFDYLIGSVHCFKLGEEYVDFDTSLEKTEAIIEKYFGGDGMSFAKMYYETLATLADHGDFNIIGHFDIISKHLEKKPLFDDKCEEYLKYAIDAMDALKGRIELFEINTGAIGRGYKTAPYPSPVLTKALLERGFKPVITTDCHKKQLLDCGFDKAIDLLRTCGAKEFYVLTQGGFKAVSID